MMSIDGSTGLKVRPSHSPHYLHNLLDHISLAGLAEIGQMHAI